MRRVVVTGLGVVAPNGSNVNKFKEALYTGKSGIKHIAELQQNAFASQVGGIPVIEESNYSMYFNLGHLGKPSSAILYGCMAAEEAWLDAGLSMGTKDSKLVNWESGIILGTGVGGADVLGNSVVPQVNAGNVKRLGSAAVEQVMVSGASAYVGGMLSLGNKVTTNSSACSTGTEAIIDAFNHIQRGEADRMLAGGCEAYSPYIWGGFDSMRVLNRNSNNEPEKASRPMSASASGFVPGAGAGVLVLEEMQFAIARSARIYAELLGGTVNCGGQKNGGSMTAPNSEAVQRCIRGALTKCNISPDEVDAISGHLTSTMADPLEVRNWAEALGRKGKDFPFINSTKSMIGHCLGAAGGIETIAAVLELYEEFFHPSINCEDRHASIAALIDHDKIPQTTKWNVKLNIIAKASFGFGDVNSCLILKKWNNK
ncbi:MAG: beta-ketoacyl-[acyl-carrier-protein] synthase family protein [Bacteroidetes bacterium]|nr:beta-ketoacyl-[acyl-carrier-protein] synthase family protein [Bacteroidota bacterium]